ncbi:ATP-binding cassette domain-containing protein [Streptomyces sp. NPDC050560]|uniref:ABC transporter ATP-binding protein n=1 Tax=Streptomyces sp. NPDC050560 TaxID=3365630 RepID=UPI00378D77ED
MIQAIGLTSTARRHRASAVDDVSFEAEPGRVTALLGAPGAGKTAVLRLMLELQRGRGVAHFRGRPLHQIPHPAREVGVVLGEVPGHPARTVLGQLRMLCAAAGVPARRADDVLEAMGLAELRHIRLGSLSRGLDRRLGLACALLPDPHTLVLDDPAGDLSAREGRWLLGVLREHAEHGGTVLFTTADPKEAARSADQVVTLDQGRVVADQAAGDFARTRLRPRVAVRSPQAARLSLLLAKEARAARRSVEVVRESGSRLSVYGSSCAGVGEIAYRHGVLVHQLADEIGDMGPSAGTYGRISARAVTVGPATAATVPGRARPARGAAVVDSPGGGTVTAEADGLPGAQDGTPQPKPPRPTPSHEVLAPSTPPAGQPPVHGATPPRPRRAQAPRTSPAPSPSALPPVLVQPGRGPLRPLRYEVYRATGVATGYAVAAGALLTSALICLLLARAGHTPQPRMLAAWPRELPLPPAALGAGLLGALAFGEEFRHPALAADRGTVPRRVGLLAAKLLVAGGTAVALAVGALGCDAAVVQLVYGPELTRVPPDWPSLTASWLALTMGCAWAGVLAGGVFRSTAAGLAAVLAVPVAVVPLLHKALAGPSAHTAAGFPARVRDLVLVQWPFGAGRYLAAGASMAVQPVGGALLLSLAALLGAYVLTGLRSRPR